MSKKDDKRRLIVLLHGWLGMPGAFGRLPKILKEQGHDVLPLFHRFESVPRKVKLEDLAARLEADLDRERRGRPTVLLAHSMGGLIALTWMIRHHAAHGRRPPIKGLVMFGTPRHGVWLQPFARAFVDQGFVPGAALARQMHAPNPFLWDLAWSELKYAKLLPSVISGAGMLRRASPVAALVGGRESDAVVPTVSSQPHATFIASNGKKQTWPSRLFRIFPGRSHTGPRGLYARLDSQEDNERMALLSAAIEGSTASAHDDAPMLRQGLCIVKHPPGAKATLIKETKDGAQHGRDRDARTSGIEDLPPVAGTRKVALVNPVVRHKDGLSLFVLMADQAGGPIPCHGLRVGEKDLSLPCKLKGGQVIYWDLPIES